MKVIEFMEKTFEPTNAYNVRNTVTCKDGFNISIQGGTEFHYCSPRRLCNIYYELELGFPSQLDDIIAVYAEEEGTTETVFGFVPLFVVETLIASHGGIV